MRQRGRCDVLDGQPHVRPTQQHQMRSTRRDPSRFVGHRLNDLLDVTRRQFDCDAAFVSFDRGRQRFFQHGVECDDSHYALGVAVLLADHARERLAHVFGQRQRIAVAFDVVAECFEDRRQVPDRHRFAQQVAEHLVNESRLEW